MYAGRTYCSRSVGIGLMLVSWLLCVCGLVVRLGDTSRRMPRRLVCLVVTENTNLRLDSTTASRKLVFLWEW